MVIAVSLSAIFSAKLFQKHWLFAVLSGHYVAL